MLLIKQQKQQKLFSVPCLPSFLNPLSALLCSVLRKKALLHVNLNSASLKKVLIGNKRDFMNWRKKKLWEESGSGCSVVYNFGHLEAVKTVFLLLEGLWWMLNCIISEQNTRYKGKTLSPVNQIKQLCVFSLLLSCVGCNITYFSCLFKYILCFGCNIIYCRCQSSNSSK